jgi:hypothetical protein
MDFVVFSFVIVQLQYQFQLQNSFNSYIHQIFLISSFVEAMMYLDL